MQFGKGLPKHGGGVFRKALKRGIAVNKIIDFSANINPLGLPPGVIMELQDSLTYLAHYPEIDGGSLQLKIAEHLQLVPEQILPGNGSTALIYLLVRVLKPEKALLLTPTFTEYERALHLVGSRISFLNYWRNGKVMEAEELLSLILAESPGMVFLCNPGNPTGFLFSPRVLRKLVRQLAARRIIVVLDEAFIDFTEPGNSLVKFTTQSHHLLILRSLTKIYALAGLRCGYLVGNSKMIARLRSFHEPWSINYPALRAAVTALTIDNGFLAETRSLVGKEREFLFAELSKIAWLTPYPSRANYILCKIWGKISCLELADFLFARGFILIRCCGDYHGLGNNYVRLAVRRPRDNRRLIALIKEFESDKSIK